MNQGDRIARAQALANHQRRISRLDAKEASQPTTTPPQEESESYLITRVKDADQSFRQTPLGPGKLWYHVCCWAAGYAWLKMLVASPLGAIILSPFILTLLWVLLSAPGWFSEGFSDGKRNSGGKYV